LAGYLGLYPNPANSSFTLERAMDDRAEVEVLDLQGRIVAVHTAMGRMTVIPVPDLAPGPYLVRVWERDRVETLRLEVAGR
jgi:hypothetical protein